MDLRTTLEILGAPVLLGLGWLIKWWIERRPTFTEIDLQHRLLDLYERLRASDLTPDEFARFRAGIERRGASSPRVHLSLHTADLSRLEAVELIEEPPAMLETPPPEVEADADLEFSTPVAGEVVEFEMPLLLESVSDSDFSFEEERSMVDIADEVRADVEDLQQRVAAAMTFLRSWRDEAEVRALDAEATAFDQYIKTAAERAASEYAGGTLSPIAALTTIESLLRQRAAELEEFVAVDRNRRAIDREE